MQKKIVIGVCGGIACYKVCDVVSLLYQKGFDVTVLTDCTTSMHLPDEEILRFMSVVYGARTTRTKSFSRTRSSPRRFPLAMLVVIVGRARPRRQRLAEASSSRTVTHIPSPSPPSSLY